MKYTQVLVVVTVDILLFGEVGYWDLLSHGGLPYAARPVLDRLL